MANKTANRLVAFASRGDSPNINRTGSEIADPEEASVFTSPAPSPATSRRNPQKRCNSVASKGFFPSEVGGSQQEASFASRSSQFVFLSSVKNRSEKSVEEGHGFSRAANDIDFLVH